ncbi:MAG: hypothetical protein K0R08_1 [Solimicrobium sp.]|nr:hypothetical protein [Solimicrobium sp.]
MLVLNRPLNNPHPAVDWDNPYPTKKNRVDDVHVINLKKRIEQNRPLIESLKRDRGFQNALNLLRRESIPDRKLLDFLTGKASLEECVDTIYEVQVSNFPLGNTNVEEVGSKKIWIVNLLVRTYEALEVKAGWFDKSDSHFLSESITDTLAAIFSHGYLESDDKTHSKMNTLMQAIEAGELDLSGADLSDMNLAGANLAGANLVGANFLNANLFGVNWESEIVMIAGKEIDRAFSMVESGQPDQIMEIFEAIYKNTKSTYSLYLSDRIMILDKLFEAALEISLAGYRETAISILLVPVDAIAFVAEGTRAAFNYEALICRAVLEEGRFHPWTSLWLKQLQKAIKKQFKEYKLMLEAQKSTESVFSHVPLELVNHIARLRGEAILVQQEFDLKV